MMDALRLVYLQYWFKSSCEETFSIHMALLKMFYCQPTKLGSSQTWILTIIDVDILNLHFFSSRSQWSLMHSGLWTSLWIWILCPSFGKNKFNALLCVYLSEFTKEAKLTMVQIMGFVEDEKTFPTLVFMKKLWNWLCEHLNLVIHMYAQPFYTIIIFI